MRDREGGREREMGGEREGGREGEREGERGGVVGTFTISPQEIMTQGVACGNVAVSAP